MFAYMESSLEASEQVRELQRAEAAPYVGMPPSPWWMAPVFASWFAAYVGVVALWGESRLAFGVGMLVLCFILGASLRGLTRRYGALPLPGRGTPPPEIRREYRRYGAGAVVIVVLVVCVWWWAGVWAASAATFALVTAGLGLYRSRYERAATLVRERLR